MLSSDQMLYFTKDLLKDQCVCTRLLTYESVALHRTKISLLALLLHLTGRQIKQDFMRLDSDNRSSNYNRSQLSGVPPSIAVVPLLHTFLHDNS